MKIFILVVMVFFLIPFNVYSSSSGSDFKNICLEMIEEYNSSLKSSSESAIDAAEANNEEETRLRHLLEKWRPEFKNIVERDPDSIWADDAQFLSIVTSDSFVYLEGADIKNLLEKYPNLKIENWTKENLPFLSILASPLLVEELKILLLIYHKHEKYELNKFFEPFEVSSKIIGYDFINTSNTVGVLVSRKHEYKIQDKVMQLLNMGTHSYDFFLDIYICDLDKKLISKIATIEGYPSWNSHLLESSDDWILIRVHQTIRATISMRKEFKVYCDGTVEELKDRRKEVFSLDAKTKEKRRDNRSFPFNLLTFDQQGFMAWKDN
ncbi:MAG: hypothetical protein ABIH45_07135 [Candidatus Omnitrophota bacterium]